MCIAFPIIFSAAGAVCASKSAVGGRPILSFHLAQVVGTNLEAHMETVAWWLGAMFRNTKMPDWIGMLPSLKAASSAKLNSRPTPIA